MFSIIRALCVVALTSGPALAASDPFPDWTVGAGGGQVHSSGRTDTELKAFGDVKISKGLSGELQYIRLGQFNTYFGTRERLDGATGGLVGNFQIDESVCFLLKGGLFHGRSSGVGSDDSFFFGAGLRIVRKVVGLRLEYERFKFVGRELGGISLSLEFNF